MSHQKPVRTVSVLKFVGGLLLFGCGIIIPFSCAQESELTLAPAGVTFKAPFVTLEDFLNHSSGREPIKNLKIKISWDGKVPPPNANLMFKFLSSHPESTPHMVSWKDLQKSSAATGCSHQVFASVQINEAGSALICDGRLDASEVRLIEATLNHTETRELTSWGTFQLSEDLLEMTLGF